MAIEVGTYKSSYYIKPSQVTLMPNDQNDPSLVYVGVRSGTYVDIYYTDRTGDTPVQVIGYGTNNSYQKWQLSGSSTKLASNAKHYIYIRLRRTEKTAMIIFSTRLYNFYGENTDGVNHATNRESYYYILTGELTATDGTSERTLTFETGTLSTPENSYDKDEADSRFLSFEIADKRYLNQVEDDTAKGIITFLQGIKMGEWEGENTTHSFQLWYDETLDSVVLSRTDGKPAHFLTTGALSTRALGNVEDEGTGSGMDYVYNVDDFAKSLDSFNKVSETDTFNAYAIRSLYEMVKNIENSSTDTSYVDGKIEEVNKKIDTNTAYLSEWIERVEDTLQENIDTVAGDLSTLQTTVNDFLTGTDTDTIINRWKELESFLNGYTETATLADLLSVKADKATTLAGYGITNAYTKTEVDNKITSVNTDLTNLQTTVSGHTTSIANLQSTVSAHTSSITSINGKITTLQGYFTNGVANSALRLSDSAEYKAWGQVFFKDGKPVNVSGAATFTQVNADSVVFGDKARLAYDSTLNALLLTRDDGTAVHFLASGAVSTRGLGDLSDSDTGGTGTGVDLLNVPSDIIPSVGATYSLGSSDNFWKMIYANGGIIGSTYIASDRVIFGTYIQGQSWAINPDGSATFSSLTINGASAATQNWVNSQLSSYATTSALSSYATNEALSSESAARRGSTLSGAQLPNGQGYSVTWQTSQAGAQTVTIPTFGSLGYESIDDYYNKNGLESFLVDGVLMDSLLIYIEDAISAGGNVDLSDYYTKSQVNSKITELVFTQGGTFFNTIYGEDADGNETWKIDVDGSAELVSLTVGGKSLGSSAYKAVDNSITEGGTGLVTSGSVYSYISGMTYWDDVIGHERVIELLEDYLAYDYILSSDSTDIVKLSISGGVSSQSITAATLKSNLGLGSAAYKGVDTSVTVNSSNLITSGAVYSYVSSMPSLSNYYTKTESDSRYATVSEIPTLVLDELDIILDNSLDMNSSTDKPVSVTVGSYTAFITGNELKESLGLGTFAYKDSLMYGEITDAPELSSVATSGSYSDLTDKPTIPTVVNSLISTSTTDALSAYQGKFLYGKIEAIEGDIMNTYSMSEVDNLLSSYVKKAGDTITGQLGFSGSTYPHIYGNGSFLVLSPASDGLYGLTFDKSSASIRARANNNTVLGSSSVRWSNVYSVLGNFSGQITSTVADGTAPFVVASKTEVANLNAMYHGGFAMLNIGFPYKSKKTITDTTNAIWYAKVTFKTGWNNKLHKIHIEAGYNNINGKVLLDVDGYSQSYGNYTVKSSKYNGNNVIGFHWGLTSDYINVLYLKLRGGSSATTTVYSTLEINTIEVVDAESVPALISLSSDGGEIWTNYNINANAATATYATSAGNADTLDGLHADSFDRVYTSSFTVTESGWYRLVNVPTNSSGLDWKDKYLVVNTVNSAGSPCSASFKILYSTQQGWAASVNNEFIVIPLTRTNLKSVGNVRLLSNTGGNARYIDVYIALPDGTTAISVTMRGNIPSGNLASAATLSFDDVSSFITVIERNADSQSGRATGGLIAEQATKLTTVRTLWGNSFDGSGNVSGNLTGVGTIIGSGLLGLVSTNNDIYLRRNGTDTTSLVLNASAFKPFDVANGLLNLGSTSARWNGIYGKTLDVTGSVSLGTADTSIGYKQGGHVVIRGTETGTIIAANGGNMLFRPIGNTSTSGQMTLLSSGNLKVGHGNRLTDDGYRLDVNGTFHTSGNATIGGSLTVNGVGITGATTDGVNQLAIDGEIHSDYICWFNEIEVATGIGSDKWSIYDGEASFTSIQSDNVLPKSNGSGSIGSSSLKWLNGYIDNLYAETINGKSIDELLAGSSFTGGEVAGQTVFSYDSVASDNYTLSAYGNVRIGEYNVAQSYYIDSKLEVYGYAYIKGALIAEDFLECQKYIYGYDTSTGSDNWMIDVDGSALFATVTQSSDIRYKDVIENIHLGLSDIADAPTFRYSWKDKNTDKLHVGSSAQYWQSLASELVLTDRHGRLSLDYSTAALVSAVSIAREVNTMKMWQTSTTDRITELEDRVKALEAENKELRELLDNK